MPGREGPFARDRREFVLNRSEDWALLFGRILVAALFLPSGFNKLVTF